MNEELVQFAWKNQLFDLSSLKTVQGDPVEIQHPGSWNFNAGPDFFNASIKIGDTLWVGNVEVHMRASDWYRHHHDSDEAYNSVILHVVTEFDKEVSLPGGSPLPALQIRINPKLLQNYERLLNEDIQPACSAYLPAVDHVYIQSAIEHCLVERLQNKTETIHELLASNKNDWNETFYQYLAVNFGFKVNALPFEMLARSLPLAVLSHYAAKLFLAEALMFGQSGLLNEVLLGDDYYLQLRDEYSYLARKHHLKGMEAHHWKFMRLRPANFPTIRIAQFAAVMNHSEALFSRLIETSDLHSLLSFFDVKASAYWDTHYRFNQETRSKVKWLGALSRHNIVINTLVPFFYLYGIRNNKPSLKYRAFELLEMTPPEQNSIISLWDERGIKAGNAYDSQALIQLKNVYCDHKKCLKCQIGNKLING